MNRTISTIVITAAIMGIVAAADPAGAGAVIPAAARAGEAELSAIRKKF